MIISPLPLILIAAAIGAGILGYVFVRSGVRWFLGLGLGAVAGGLGSLLFMIPLDFCTFEAEQAKNDRAFGFLLVGIGMLIVLAPVGWISLRLLRRGSLTTATVQPEHGAFRNGWIAIPLLAPTLAVLLLFLYYPSIETVRLSAHLSRLGAKREAFVCVANYTRLVENSDYLSVVLRTMYISGAIVILSMGLALLIATMAYLPVRGASIYRTLLVWPYAISPAVAGLIFLLMFNPVGGIVNYLLDGAFGIKPGWTNDPDVAPWTIILASVWKSMGYNILFYIAGLQNVPGDLIEASAIDGAGVLRRFWRIVLPLLSPTTFFLIITNMTYAFFDTYATIDYLTPGGGPLESTNTMMYQVAQLGVFGERADLGKAAAESIVLFVMVIGMTIVMFRTGGRQVNYGA
ncbi:MAG TPA: sugar ABC transporter permease [Aggregatilineales bacterium]|nr:sugar ABC transporter permease [Aggregatilineales bacterium]